MTHLSVESGKPALILETLLLLLLMLMLIDADVDVVVDVVVVKPINDVYVL